MIRIEYLADHPSQLPTVAAWQHAEFAYLNPSLSIEARKDRLRLSLQKEQLPLVLLAISDDGQALGTASLLSTTLTHQHLTPWLSTVVVPPAHRQQGIASALSLQAVAKAGALGFKTLYLFTPHNESLYARLGWHTMERAELNSVPITIMAMATTGIEHP